MMRRLALILFVALLAAYGPLNVLAQEQPAVPDNIKPLVENAQKEGMTVIVMAPKAAVAAAAQPARQSAGQAFLSGITDTGLKLRSEITRIVANAPQIPIRIASALQAASPDGTYVWLVKSVLVAIAGSLLGMIPARMAQAWGRERFRFMWKPKPRDQAEKAGYLLFRALMMTVSTLIMFVTAMLVAIIFDNDHDPSRETVFLIVSAIVAWRFRSIVFFNLLAPDAPSHRLVNLSDKEARAIYGDVRWALGISIVTIAFCDWLQRLNLDPDAHKLSLIVSLLISGILIAYLVLRHRAAVKSMVLGAGDPEEKPAWRRIIAGVADDLGLAYLVVAFVVSTGRVILGLPSASYLIAAPAIAVIGAMAGYAFLLIIIEWYYRGRRVVHDLRLKSAIREAVRERQREEQARSEVMREGVEEGEVIIEHDGERSEVAKLPAETVFRPMFKPLLERSAAIFVTLMAIGYVLAAWDVKIGERGNPLTAFMGTLVVVFFAWFLYRAIGMYVDRKLEDEGVSSGGQPADIEDEPAGVGTTRLGTLLPLLRNVLSVMIVAVAGMIVLSNLGVDIAPLFAGAGVVGLAVGFGAQTMIRDIFSGGFFLFDDAFRKGEYIELGDIRGTVEKISLRSFQLRHHNGPLHTVPFGEISQLTNYSRDWVVMKLPLRLTYDTDVDRVRKLIKKLGQELLNHPEVGGHFLQPLKSQGVIEMGDSAIIIRVKFMTKPGDQWQTRKVVYAAIQELFNREGIRFASREVTVRIEGDAAADDENVRLAASAAARRILDDEGKQKQGGGEDR